MTEPHGLNMSLDDLIKKRAATGTGKGAGPAARGGRGSGAGGGLAVRGGVQKSDRKQQQNFGAQRQQAQGFHQPPHRGGFGGGFGGGFKGRGGASAGQFQQRRGGFGGRGGFGDRQHSAAPAAAAVQTYLDDDTGNVVVKLKATEVVCVSPAGEILLSTGGWFTQTTLDTMNRALNVLQIRVTATGDVREGAWQVAYGPLFLRYYDGIVLHPKNPATAAQRAPMVLAAMSGAAAAAPPAAHHWGGDMIGGGGGAMLPSAAAAMGTMGGGGGNPLGPSAATAAALAAGVMARARAALGLGSLGGMSGLSTLQQQYMASLADQTEADGDVIRRLKAQGRL
ncbi:hypothetical protein TSOC_013760 [Tetrabaena socialis]|uniref:Uncharacterized protein n=1 Tax=Tetrabaena socialis TaxID=47790 RepID=A0A2J7ZJJ1_9CHLO|nr:hypothetical protein TSOC_013760 [Tetrabaena socialis]|eukprot:PNH00420.1 hypothetical protein TSOC_013760 [Tetrabaena socialis]